jgi:bla regulator protein blaR1
MMLYLAKSSTCLLILLVLYKLALEPEKMHRFNRVYLLGSLVFAGLIPLVPIQWPGLPTPLPGLTTTAVQVADFMPGLPQTATRPMPKNPNGFAPEQIGWLLYWFGCAVFFGRFVHNLLVLIRVIRTSPMIRVGNARLVLMPDDRLPYTFLNWIFVNQVVYERRALEPELFTHELAHVRQGHSLDILFVELLRIFGWFNPLFTGYKRAIQLNHEFLADDAVNATHGDIAAYRRLLLSKATGNSHLILTSALTFQPTKQRFLMMTKQTAPARAVALQLMAGLLLPVLTLVFGGAAMPVSTPPAPNATPAPDATRPTSQTDTTAAKKAVYYKNNVQNERQSGQHHNPNLRPTHRR